MANDKFVNRHIGPREKDIKDMLSVIGVSSLDELINQTVPSNIRLDKPLNLPNGLTEREYYRRILNLASKNKVFKHLHWYGMVRYHHACRYFAKHSGKPGVVYFIHPISG